MNFTFKKSIYMAYKKYSNNKFIVYKQFISTFDSYKKFIKTSQLNYFVSKPNAFSAIYK